VKDDVLAAAPVADVAPGTATTAGGVTALAVDVNEVGTNSAAIATTAAARAGTPRHGRRRIFSSGVFNACTKYLTVIAEKPSPAGDLGAPIVPEETPSKLLRLGDRVQ
jgi:hypothetical protein